MAMQEELAKKRTVDRQSEADLKQAVLNAEKGACHAATASARIASHHRTQHGSAICVVHVLSLLFISRVGVFSSQWPKMLLLESLF